MASNFNVKLLLRAIRLWLGGPASRSVRGLLILRSMAKRTGRHRLAHFFSRRMQRYGVYVAFGAEISDSVKFPHPTGIVIGDGVVVEDGVWIFQNVTLGGARIGDFQEGNYPHIGSGTTIFAGAVIIGKIEVGQGCTIGANAVVLKDVPDFSTAIGVPARIVGQRYENEFDQ